MEVMNYGLWQVDCCYKESGIKILWVNIKLYFIWLFKIKVEDK